MTISDAQVGDAGLRPAERVPGTKVKLRVLATSDLHMNVVPFDYYADSPCPQRGLALTASLIEQARAEAVNTMLFDNGDFLLGSPMSDFLALHGTAPNPMIDAMNRLSYDAVNLGNHEFSQGIDSLFKAMRRAEFPFVCANVFHKATADPLIAPFALLRRRVVAEDGSMHPLTIGVTGVLPPQTALWEGQAIGDKVDIADMVETLRGIVPRLKQAGADVVIVLAHCGLGTDFLAHSAENAGIAISGIPGINALVLGHVHLTFPTRTTTQTGVVDPHLGLVNGVPTVMPGVFGSHLGVIDLTMEHTEAGWIVAEKQAEARPVARRNAFGAASPLVEASGPVIALADNVHRATRRWAARPIGRSPSSIHSFFSMITEDRSRQIVHAAQLEHARSLLRNSALAELPILSATAPFRAGGRAGPENYCYVRAGEILLRHAADLYIHTNSLVLLQITGADLRNWLENATRVFLPITVGQQDQPLFDPEFPSFHFDSVCGVTYDIDLTSKCGESRIRNLHWNDLPVRADQKFILVTNSFRGQGTGAFFNPAKVQVALSDSRSVRDLLVDHLGATERMPLEPPNWRFLPVPDTSVTFDTSPKAADLLSDVAHLDLTPLDVMASGFLRVRLTL